MRGLPKSYAKMGFKKGWKAYKASKTGRKLNKRRTTKRKVVGVKSMAKRRRRYTRTRARRAKRKIPLETAVALVAVPFTPAWPGGQNLIQYAQRGNYKMVGEVLTHGFLGLHEGGFDIMKSLNPFDMNYARFSKMLFWSGIMARIRKKAVKIPFEKVPIIGRYIS